MQFRKLGLDAGFEPKQESAHSMIFTNEGKRHERIESKARHQKFGSRCERMAS
jgi:hypothetical protein